MVEDRAIVFEIEGGVRLYSPHVQIDGETGEITIIEPLVRP